MDSQDLQELALKEAKDGFDKVVQRLVEAADANAQVLTIAGRETSQGGEDAGSPEHVAFTYLSAAYRSVHDLGDD